MILSLHHVSAIENKQNKELNSVCMHVHSHLLVSRDQETLMGDSEKKVYFGIDRTWHNN